ncbi:MAG: FAD:protein FMN transferase [Actinomycetota bacterium]
MPLTATTASWPAMGTTVTVRLSGRGAEDGLALAQRRVAELEARWSRFRPDSDVGRLNRASGHPVRVHPKTLELLDTARTWWQATDGRFDPTVADALAAAGYDRDRATGHGPVRTGAPAPGAAGLVLDRRDSTVRLPEGVHLDLGGIGKGRTADLLATDLGHLDHGLVDLGGDLRVWGGAPEGHGWPVAVDDLRDGSQLALLGLDDGAVTTSSTLVRCWTDGDRRAHHLIDPRTGQPVEGEVVSVTVVAGRAAPAEVLAKAAIVTGTVDGATALLAGHGAAALIVPAQGPVAAVGDVLDLCWTPPREVR